MSLNERDLAKSLAEFRGLQLRHNQVNNNNNNSSYDCSSSNSSSNNPSILNSGWNSCDSLRETDDFPTQSFLEDTLRNRYHILYEVFHSPEKGKESDFDGQETVQS